MEINYAKTVCRQAFDKLVQAVEAGKSEKLIEYLKAMGRFHRYSAGNVILINFQKPEATHVAGFRAWQKLGRRVKKGEHGIAIMAPIVWRRRVVGAGEEAENENAKEETTIAFRTAYVFDVTQTDGKPLPEFARVQGDPAGYAERLKEYIAEQRIKVEYSDAIGSVEGMSCGGVIKIKKSLSPAEAFSVLVHELTHEMLHKDRANMPKEKKVRETEAEATAFVVCYGVGLNVNSAGSDYVQLYDGEKKTLLASLDRIQKTASEILTAITPDKEPVSQSRNGQRCLAEAA